MAVCAQAGRATLRQAQGDSRKPGTETAFSNGRRYGAPIAPGKIIRRDLFNRIPMNPPVSVVELTGAEILEMPEKNLESTFSKDPMQQLGGYAKRCVGLTVSMRMENPESYRIQEAFVGKERLEAGKTYQVGFVTEQGVPRGAGRSLDIHEMGAMEAFLEKNGAFTAQLPAAFNLV